MQRDLIIIWRHFVNMGTVWIMTLYFFVTIQTRRWNHSHLAQTSHDNHRTAASPFICFKPSSHVHLKPSFKVPWRPRTLKECCAGSRPDVVLLLEGVLCWPTLRDLCEGLQYVVGFVYSAVLLLDLVILACPHLPADLAVHDSVLGYSFKAVFSTPSLRDFFDRRNLQYHLRPRAVSHTSLPP